MALILKLEMRQHLARTYQGGTMSTVDSSRDYVVAEQRSGHGIVSRVTATYGSVRVWVQGEGDHPQTRRARARKAVRAALGSEWDILDYHGAMLMTHCHPVTREVWGSLHDYSAVRVA